MEGKGVNIRKVINNLKDIAKEAGAKELQIEAIVINDRLKSTLVNYFGMVPSTRNWRDFFGHELSVLPPYLFDRMTFNLYPKTEAISKIQALTKPPLRNAENSPKTHLIDHEHGVSIRLPTIEEESYIYTEHMGKNVGGLKYFDAYFTMKTKDIANIFVCEIKGENIKSKNIKGEHIKIKNIMEILIKAAKETGAKTLEIESVLTNTKLKNYLIKHYDLVRGERNWDLIGLEEDSFCDIKRFDKITIPLYPESLPKISSNKHSKID
jgi:hypothetical protein